MTKLARQPFLLSANPFRRWRAGFLAACFAFFTVLPWFHVLSHADCVSPAPDDGVVAIVLADAAAHCWVCQSLATLLDPGERPVQEIRLQEQPLAILYFAVAPERHAVAFLNPAHRPTAPPAVSYI
jgi:hypothetical protein